MEMKERRHIVLGSVLAILVILVASFWLMNRGYGDVSPRTYEFSGALYSACLKKNEEQVAIVAEMLKETDDKIVSRKERKWLRDIISTAENGNWQTAASRARRMMEDQVDYSN